MLQSCTVRNPVRKCVVRMPIYLPELLFLPQVAVHYCQDISGLRITSDITEYYRRLLACMKQRTRDERTHNLATHCWRNYQGSRLFKKSLDDDVYFCFILKTLTSHHDGTNWLI